jgi:hypothetical protein
MCISGGRRVAAGSWLTASAVSVATSHSVSNLETSCIALPNALITIRVTDFREPQAPPVVYLAGSRHLPPNSRGFLRSPPRTATRRGSCLRQGKSRKQGLVEEMPIKIGRLG